MSEYSNIPNTKKLACKLSADELADDYLAELKSQSDGYYNPYHVSVELLEHHKFCSLTDFVDFINLYENLNLHVESDRESVIQNFKKLQIKTPFGLVTQFPKYFCVDMDSTKIKTASVQFMDILDVLNLFGEMPKNIRLNYKGDITIALITATQLYREAFRTLGTICKSTDKEYLKENGIYTRETFEEKYDLKWVYVPQ